MSDERNGCGCLVVGALTVIGVGTVLHWIFGDLRVTGPTMALLLLIALLASQED